MKQSHIHIVILFAIVTYNECKIFNVSTSNELAKALLGVKPGDTINMTGYLFHR